MDRITATGFNGEGRTAAGCERLLQALKEDEAIGASEFGMGLAMGVILMWILKDRLVRFWRGGK